MGYWLNVLAVSRRRLLRTVAGLTERELDAPPPVGVNTIGTLLYHVAGADLLWIYQNWLQQPFPADLADLFPAEMWDAEDFLARMRGRPLEDYLHRLEAGRAKVLDFYRGLTLAQLYAVEWRTGWDGNEYDVSPWYMIIHLTQHEAEHRGQIDFILESIGWDWPGGPPPKPR